MEGGGQSSWWFLIASSLKEHGKRYGQVPHILMGIEFLVPGMENRGWVGKTTVKQWAMLSI